MRLSFRQGIARYQRDSNGNPIFLQRSANGQFVDLIVSPEPCVLVLAHNSATYVVDELKTVHHAWGPLSGSQIKYLFWDVNLLTGALSRGLTLLPPIYNAVAPTSPAVDQHWFDTVDTVFKVWNGSKWVEKIRLFAGTISSGSIIHPAHIGSQAGLVGDNEGGSIMLDSFGAPLRQSNGTFVTTTTWLNVVNMGAATARLDAPVMSCVAAEELPSYSLVQLKPGRRAGLARSTDYKTRVAGIIINDLAEGEIGNIISSGLVQNSAWSWPSSAINKPLFCGSTGALTLVPPNVGVLLKVGFIYDTDSIFIDLHPAVVLDDPNSSIPPPESPPESAPTANFSADVITGTAPLTVNFTSTSTGATSLEWDFINDGFVSSTAAAPSYVYATPGLYTVRLRAINIFGQDDEIKSNYINVLEPSAGALNVNLGITMTAATHVAGGSPFSFQVTVTNAGLANAANVQRVITLRSTTGDEVTIVSPPVGSVVARSGPLTTITLPTISIASGNFSSITLQAQVSPGAKAVQLSGVVTSSGTDSEAGDNQAALSLMVRT